MYRTVELLPQLEHLLDEFFLAAGDFHGNISNLSNFSNILPDFTPILQGIKNKLPYKAVMGWIKWQHKKTFRVFKTLKVCEKGRPVNYFRTTGCALLADDRQVER